MKNLRTLTVIGLAIIFGLAAGYSALRYLSDRPTPILTEGDEETVPMVLASRDLPLGTVLDEDHLAVVDWPVGVAPAGFASTKEELVGRSLISQVDTNEPILATKLADSGLLGLIPLIPPGMRALSVRVDDVVGVAGFVTPQTRVDIILIMTPPGGQDPISKTILQNIQALAAGSEIQETEDGLPVTVTVVTVLVTPEDAEKLALAAQEGRIQMALRHTLDLESVVTSGERKSRLFAGGGSGTYRATSSSGSSTTSARESIIEIYRGGVRTLISY
ncbi:MAG: Flp pilus assembly protein CpaB [Gemmatimonadetes bacterium]|nr:Flp pilus assembly protein CpaB [Gemmatimonadota bacterium]NNM07444.1 Flp pilus assembly protein CpaB [Gemmatimonadota bacterium]